MLDSPQILQRLRALIESGSKFFGIFDRSCVSRMRALELLDLLYESIPEEIEQANRILSEREKIIEDAKTQAGEIVDDAAKEAERLTDADEITRKAIYRAGKIGDESDEYVLGRLEQLEKELLRITEEVRAGEAEISKKAGRPNRPDNFSIDKR
ncbi:MAG: hypothetical protein ABIC40_01430 [bacterium]